MTGNTSSLREDRNFFILNALVSTGALAFLTWLILRGPSEVVVGDLSFLPALNASFNALAATLLTAGWLAIRKKKQTLHKALMSGAFVASSCFLVGYIVYHYVHGDTIYEGPYRGAYLAMLASHVVLSIPVVPMALSAFYFAWKEKFDRHRKLTRVLAPIWIYVSVTGVLVFLALHVL